MITQNPPVLKDRPWILMIHTYKLLDGMQQHQQIKEILEGYFLYTNFNHSNLLREWRRNLFLAEEKWKTLAFFVSIFQSPIWIFVVFKNIIGEFFFMVNCK